MSGATPLVATSTTVPRNPSSATTRLLPPARTRTGSPDASAASTASMRCCSDSARTKRAAGPPSRRVVWSASSSGTQDCLGHAEHLLPVAGDGQRHGGEAFALLGLPTDLDVDAA